MIKLTHQDHLKYLYTLQKNHNMSADDNETDEQTLMIVEEVIFGRKCIDPHLSTIIALVEKERKKTSFFEHLKVFKFAHDKY